MNTSSSRRSPLSAAALFVLLALLSVACVPAENGSDAGSRDADDRDAEALDSGRDAGPTDAGPPDASQLDASVPDASVPGASPIDDHGFAIRKPIYRTILCEGPECPDPTSTARDQDHVCTFKYRSIDGFLYFQATPLRSTLTRGLEFKTEGGWVSVDGRPTPVEASYDYGSNHHNDSLRSAEGDARRNRRRAPAPSPRRRGPVGTARAARCPSRKRGH